MVRCLRGRVSSTMLTDIIEAIGFGVLLGSIVMLCTIIPITCLYKLIVFMWSFVGLSPFVSIWLSIILIISAAYYVVHKF